VAAAAAPIRICGGAQKRRTGPAGAAVHGASPRLWAALGLSPTLVDRITRWSGWGGPLLVTLMAGVMRFYHLGSRRRDIRRDVLREGRWALVHRGFEVNWDKNANDLILQHNGHIAIPSDAAYVVHPPVGKYVIGIGELIFGFNPFGWRFMTALLGTLAILMLCRIGRRLFRSSSRLRRGVLMSPRPASWMARTSLLDERADVLRGGGVRLPAARRDRPERNSRGAARRRRRPGPPRRHIADTLFSAGALALGPACSRPRMPPR